MATMQMRREKPQQLEELVKKEMNSVYWDKGEEVSSK